MRISPLGATLGAVVDDVALARLTDEEWHEIVRAFHEQAVLVFPGQFLDQDEHTDSSYMPVSAKASMLSALVVPPAGGDTEWADMRAAYDALDEETRDRVTGLCAHHSIAYSQAKAGFDSTFGYGVDQPAQLRPLVKVHPATGRPALFIGRHAHAVPGLEPEASDALLNGLLDRACRPPRVYRHRWEPGDLVVWDNRCVLHRACEWDLAEPRSMRHTRIAGDPATEASADPAPR